MRADDRGIAARRRRDPGEPLDEGFSVIELVIVVVILGILAAIAIPIFLNIQAQAEQSALDAVAADGATQVATYLARNPGAEPEQADVDNLEQDGIVLTVTGSDVDDLCVVAARDDGRQASSGPGGGCAPRAAGTAGTD